MNRLYRDFLYVPKHGRIREKVMLTRTVLTVVFMIVCLASLSLTAYAYFSSSLISSTNVIRSASFNLSVTAAESGTSVDVISVGNGKYTAELEEDKTYTVTLRPAGTASTGFCVLTANGYQYHTCQLGVDANAPGGRRDEYSFTLQVDQNTTVTVIAHWGTSSYYGYTNEYYISGDNASVTIQAPASRALSVAPPAVPETTAPTVTESTPPAVSSTPESTSTPETEPDAVG